MAKTIEADRSWHIPTASEHILASERAAAVHNLLSVVAAHSPRAVAQMVVLYQHAAVQDAWEWCRLLRSCNRILNGEPGLVGAVRAKTFAYGVPDDPIFACVQPLPPWVMTRTALGQELWTTLSRAEAAPHDDFSDRVRGTVSVADLVAAMPTFARLLARDDSSPSAARRLERVALRAEVAVDGSKSFASIQAWSSAVVATAVALEPIVADGAPRAWGVLCSLAVPPSPPTPPILAHTSVLDALTHAGYDLGEQDMLDAREDDDEYKNLINRAVASQRRQLSAYIAAHPQRPAGDLSLMTLARIVVDPEIADAALLADDVPARTRRCGALAMLFGLFDAPA
jgi:hypothetical protein